jgi:hypothetical protein
MDPLGLLLAPSLAKPFEDVEPVSKRGYDRSHAIGGIGARHCGRLGRLRLCSQNRREASLLSAPGVPALGLAGAVPASVTGRILSRCTRLLVTVNDLALLAPDWLLLAHGTGPFAPLNTLARCFRPPATCTRITLHTRASSMQSSKIVQYVD